MTLRLYGYILTGCLLLGGCSEKKKFTISSDMEIGENKNSNQTFQSLQKVMKSLHLELEFREDEIQKEADIISMVESGEIDLGIVKNDVDIHDSFHKVRTLLPLFPDVLLVLCKNNSTHLPIAELLHKDSSAMIIDKIEEKNIIDLFLRKNGINSESIQVIHSADSSAIIEGLNEYSVLITFASLNSIGIRNILRTWDGQIYSLDDPQLKGQGSIVDGFCLAYPKAVPFIIPKGTFGKWPLKPVLTFSIYDVLVCREDFDVNQGYDIVKTIYDMGSTLAEDDFEFGLLDPNIELHKFSFPLHPAAIKYIKRDQPTFWERESELIGLGISLLVLASGGITTLIQYFRQRKKDRVDVYYLRALQIADKARKAGNVEEKEKFLSELHEVRNSAFDQLVKEKLAANESFIIFTNLLNATISEVEYNIRMLRK